MAFEEIIKSRKSYREGAPAVFSTNAKGVGSLRFNRVGMEFLSGQGPEWTAGTMVNLFHDPDSGEVALKRAEGGKFRLSWFGKDKSKVRITSNDLGKRLQSPTEFDIKGSEEYDAVLVPRG